MVTTSIEPRWVQKDRYHRARPDDLCTLCGTRWGGYPNRVCKATTCMACGSTQCMVNGLGNGQCSVCYIGILPGWSGWDRKCGYAKCGNPAVAVAPRVKNVCRDHLSRAKVDQGIERALNERSKFWVMVP